MQILGQKIVYLLKFHYFCVIKTKVNTSLMKKITTLILGLALSAAPLYALTRANSSVRFKATPHRAAFAAPADSLSWKEVGTGQWRDDILTSLGKWVDVWPVAIEECQQIPGYYRAINPYGNGQNTLFMYKAFDCGDIYFHAENPNYVYTDYTELKGISIAYKDEQGNELKSRVGLYEIGGYYLRYFAEMGGATPEDIAAMGIPFGKFADGHITFLANAFGLDAIDANDALDANTSGLFRLSFPGAKDYELSFSSIDVCASTPKYTATCTRGADVTGVKYAMLPGRPSADSMLEALNAAPITTADSVELSAEWGVNTLMAASIKPDGTIGETATTMVYGVWPDSDKWKSLGVVKYGEAFVSDAVMDADCDAYDVEIEENIATPGLYRLVDPYGKAYPRHEEFSDSGYVLNHDHKHYVLIDARDPQRVMIPASPIGLDFQSGPLQVFSSCWDAIYNNGDDMYNPALLEDFGTLKDGVITFPGGTLRVYEPLYGTSLANLQHKFRIVLPDASGISSVAADSAAPTLYYRIDGTPVARPDQSGVYLRRAAGKVEKIVVR